MSICCVARVGVSSEPGIINLELEPSHKMIILASDGVWEFISSKEGVDIVSKADSPEEGCRLVRWGKGLSGIDSFVCKIVSCDSGRRVKV